MNEPQRRAIARNLTANMSHALEDLGLYLGEGEIAWNADNHLEVRWAGSQNYLIRLPGSDTYELQWEDRAGR